MDKHGKALRIRNRRCLKYFGNSIWHIVDVHKYGTGAKKKKQNNTVRYVDLNDS